LKNFCESRVHQRICVVALFVILIDEVTENARKGWMKEILYVDDLVLMGESMTELRGNFDQWKRAFESKGMKVNHGKT